MKKTTAILGDRGNAIHALTEVLLQQDLQLLFVSEDEAVKHEIKRQLENHNATAEIDLLSCERDCCWEADMIVLVNPDPSSAALIEKIKEVATQKIVLVASEGKELNENSHFRELFPWSKVVEANLDSIEKKISLCSKDADANEEVERLFEASGYQLK